MPKGTGYSTDESNIPKKSVNTYKTAGYENEGVVNSSPLPGKLPHEGVRPLPSVFDTPREHIAHKKVQVPKLSPGVSSDEGSVKDRGVVDTHQ